MREYVDFLGGQSPYDALEASDRDALAGLIEVDYFVAGTTITTAQVFLALAPAWRAAVTAPHATSSTSPPVTACCTGERRVRSQHQLVIAITHATVSPEMTSNV
jgi:hypothetical protein